MKKKQDLNINQVFQDAREMKRGIQNSTDGLETDDIVNEIRNSENSSDVNFTVSKDIEDLQNKTEENKLSKDQIDLVIKYETEKQIMIDALTEHIDALTFMLQSNGSCFNGKSCEQDPRCCRRALCLLSNQTCTEDSNCTITGDKCAIDTNRTGKLIIRIEGFQKGTIAPNTSSMRNSLTVVEDASKFDTSYLDSSIQELDDAIVKIKEDKTINEMQNMSDSIRKFNTSDVTKKIDDLNRSVSDFGFDSLKGKVTEMNSSFDQVRDGKKQVNDAISLVDVIYNLTFIQLNIWLKQVSEPILRNIRDERGIAEMMTQMFSVYDNFTNYVNTSLKNVASFMNASSLIKKSQEVDAWKKNPLYNTINILSSNEVADHGSIYYLASVLVSFDPNITKLVSHTDNTQNQIFINKNKEKYSNNSLCLTDKCIETFIDFINTKPIKEVHSSLFPGEPFPLPIPVIGDFSREMILGLPFLFPLIVTIICLVAALLICSNATKNLGGKLSTCACIFTFCQLPVIFLIIGIFYPFFVILPGDFCLGGVNLGYQALKTKGDEVCTSIPKGTGTLNNCTIEIDKNFSISVTIDLEKLYSSYIGSNCDLTNDPTKDLSSSFKSSLQIFPDTFSDSVISRGEFKDGVRKDLLNFGDYIMNNLTMFIDDLSDVINCEALHNTIGKVKESLCCNVLTAMYWALSSWFLMAFTMCCCGLPSTTLARKRFPSDLWGDEYNEIKKEGTVDDKSKKKKKRKKEKNV